MRTVSNSEFERELANVENQKMMGAASRDFIKYIPYGERKQLKCIALWKSLGQYDSDFGIKFLTYLYYCVRWECLTYLNRDKESIQNLRRQNTNLQPLEDDNYLYYEVNFTANLEMEDIYRALRNLPDRWRWPIEHKFLHGKTLREIGEDEGVTYEAIRKRIVTGLEKLCEILERN